MDNRSFSEYRNHIGTSWLVMRLSHHLHHNNRTRSYIKGLTNHICAKIIYQNSTYVYSFPIKVDKITVLSLKDLTSVLTDQTNSTANITSNISIRLQFQNSKDAFELVLIRILRFCPISKNLCIEISYRLLYEWIMAFLQRLSMTRKTVRYVILDQTFVILINVSIMANFWGKATYTSTLVG